MAWKLNYCNVKQKKHFVHKPHKCQDGFKMCDHIMVINVWHYMRSDGAEYEML